MSESSLTSLLYFLAFGALFYWMMKRGGCGMHAHGGHGGHRSEDTDGPGDQAGSGGHARAVPADAPRDPVCGMAVDPERAAGMRTVDRLRAVRQL